MKNVDTKKPNLIGFFANSLTFGVSAVNVNLSENTSLVYHNLLIPCQQWQKECLNSSCGVVSGLRTGRKTPTAKYRRQADLDNPRWINSTWDRSPFIGISHISGVFL